MTERWSDEEVDLGLRALFAEARHPAAPSTLRMHARTVVAGGPRPRRFGLAAGPRVRGLVAVMATLALALAVTSAVLIVRPGSRVASQASPSPSPSATAPNALPARVTGGGFVWTRLSLPTEPWKFGWRLRSEWKYWRKWLLKSKCASPWQSSQVAAVFLPATLALSCVPRS